MSSCQLSSRRCTSCEGGIPPLAEDECRALLRDLSGWNLNGKAIAKTFGFANHYEAMAFVNAVAWVSHRENHHPELTIGYKEVLVRYWTHAIDGLSENDFICAAKIEKLLEI